MEKEGVDTSISGGGRLGRRHFLFWYYNLNARPRALITALPGASRPDREHTCVEMRHRNDITVR